MPPLSSARKSKSGENRPCAFVFASLNAARTCGANSSRSAIASRRWFAKLGAMPVMPASSVAATCGRYSSISR